MPLFAKFNKRQADSHEPATTPCQTAGYAVQSVKILGSGCAKCRQLESAVREALHLLGLQAPVEHVTDYSKIAAYGVLTTPALVINEKVVTYGKVLKPDAVIRFIQNLGE